VSSQRVRFHLDEHIPRTIAVALRRHGIDVTTTVEAGLRQQSDSSHLWYASKENRVLVTHDADFLQLHASGVEHAGIAYCAMGARSIGQMITMLRLIYEVLTSEEMRNSVEYF
jgi:predicted nuclease of predicted toxin-antitoxin system